MPNIAGTIALIEEEQRRIDVFLLRKEVPFPPATRVLLVGPHPDDNLLGPGGTALKYLAQGIPVHSVCITDGRACIPADQDRDALVLLRAAEERACAAAMGLPEPELYGIPEDRLADPGSLEAYSRQLQATLERWQPDALFVPYFLESHPLHRYTTFLVARALRSGSRDCQVYSWALGSFPPPSFVVDITAEFPRKQALCAQHASQMALRDYPGELEVISRLHATYATSAAVHAEAFFAQPRAAFVADILARGLDRPEALQAGVQPMRS